MPSVVFWPGIGGGTEHYRCRTPGAGLERAGWDVRYVTGEPDDNLLADVVVLQRVMHPDTRVLIEALQAHGVRVVYDIDDWYDGIPKYNPYRADLPTLHAALQAADLITCSTPEIAEGYARYGPTAVLPNYLDPAMWTGNYRQPRTNVHIGWLGHAAARSADIDLLKPWLPKFLHNHPRTRFAVAGSDEKILAELGVPGLVAQPDKSHIRPFEHLPAVLAWFDVGLVPLCHNRFNQAKSWCKGLEYNACGVPVVASPSREYRTFVRPGVNGLLVKRNEWGRAIERVLADLDGYRKRAREYAQRFFIDEHIHRWADAYKGVL